MTVTATHHWFNDAKEESCKFSRMYWKRRVGQSIKPKPVSKDQNLVLHRSHSHRPCKLLQKHENQSSFLSKTWITLQTLQVACTLSEWTPANYNLCPSLKPARDQLDLLESHWWISRGWHAVTVCHIKSGSGSSIDHHCVNNSSVYVV